MAGLRRETPTAPVLVKKRVNDDHVVGYKEKLFLQIWERWGEPFAKQYEIRDRQRWNEFWDTCQYTEKQIYMALRNIHYSVNKGYYERRFVSPDPCKFIQGDMINRGLSDEFECQWNAGNYDDPNLIKLRDD
jgi:hypothetical protein